MNKITHILGIVNSGKTTELVNQMVISDKNRLFITIEESSKSIHDKINITCKDIAHDKVFDECGKFRIFECKTLQDVINVCELFITKYQKIDELYIDMAELLDTQGSNRYAHCNIISNFLVKIAMKYNCHIITSQQVHHTPTEGK